MRTDHIDVTEKQAIAALAAQGKSNRAIGKAVGRSDKTVAKVLKEPDAIMMKQEIEDRLAGHFEILAEKILLAVSEDDLLKASLQQKSISAATMVDKARLIRGRSTNNTSVFFHIVASAPDLPED